MSKKIKKIIALGLVLSVSMQLCACMGKADSGEDNKDHKIVYTIDGEEIPRELTFDAVTKDGKTITMNCTVDVKGFEDASMYSIDKVSIDDEYLIDLADKLFDDGKYSVLEPYGVLSAEDIDRMDKEYLENGVYTTCANSDIEHASTFKYFDKVPMPDNKVIVDTESFFGAREARIRGTINGIMYELYYLDVNDKQMLDLYQVKPAHPCTSCISAPYVSEMKDSEILDKQNANMIAGDYFSKFDAEDYTLSSVSARMCKYHNQDNYSVSGYEYVYKRRINGVAQKDYLNDFYLNMYSSSEEMLEKFENGKIEGFSDSTYSQFVSAIYDESWDMIVMDIDDTGLVFMRLMCFYQLVEMPIDNLKKLKFEQCLDSAKNIIKEYPSMYLNIYNNVDENEGNYDVNIAFQYAPYIYNEKEMYVPVMVLEIVSDYGEGPNKAEVMFGINVIDGEGKIYEHRLKE